MDSLKRYALEIALGALLGGAVAALIVGFLGRQQTTAGPWVMWATVAAGIAAAVWYGESVHRQKRRA